MFQEGHLLGFPPGPYITMTFVNQELQNDTPYGIHHCSSVLGSVLSNLDYPFTPLPSCLLGIRTRHRSKLHSKMKDCNHWVTLMGVGERRQLLQVPSLHPGNSSPSSSYAFHLTASSKHVSRFCALCFLRKIRRMRLLFCRKIQHKWNNVKSASSYQLISECKTSWTVRSTIKLFCLPKNKKLHGEIKSSGKSANHWSFKIRPSTILPELL